MLFVCNPFQHSFCQGIAPKNFWAVHNKFFAPLTTTENSIINTRAERSPAPRLNCATTLRCLWSPLRPLTRTCSHLTRPLVDVSHLPPLIRGRTITLRLSFRLWGYEEFWGAGGNSENSPCRFCFFWRPKENYFPFLLPFALKRKAFVCDPGHSVKVLVVFGGTRPNCSACSSTLRIGCSSRGLS